VKPVPSSSTVQSVVVCGVKSRPDPMKPLLQRGEGGVLPGVLRGDALGVLRRGCFVIAAAQRDLPDEHREQWTATANTIAQMKTWQIANAIDSRNPVRTGAGSCLSAAGSTRPPPLVSAVPVAPGRWASCAMSFWLKTAPKSETPKEPPMERK
jgi:hypothetical protein